MGEIVMLSATIKDSYLKYTYQDTSSLQTLPREKEKAEQFNKVVGWLRHHKVKVGLLESAPARSKKLFAIHEYGSPAMNIPARPILPDYNERPYFLNESVRPILQMILSVDFNDPAAISRIKAMYMAIGMDGVRMIQNKIDSHIPPPNAPITLHGGWMRHPVTHKPVYIKGKQGDTPLIDTGQYRNSISYEIVYEENDVTK